MIAAVSTAVLIGILALLHVWPQALGNNVGGAAGLLAMVPLAPLARNLMEFQGELFFSLDRMGLRGLYSGLMVVLKAGALALLLAPSTPAIPAGASGSISSSRSPASCPSSDCGRC